MNTTTTAATSTRPTLSPEEAWENRDQHAATQTLIDSRLTGTDAFGRQYGTVCYLIPAGTIETDDGTHAHTATYLVYCILEGDAWPETYATEAEARTDYEGRVENDRDGDLAAVQAVDWLGEARDYYAENDRPTVDSLLTHLGYDHVHADVMPAYRTAALDALVTVTSPPPPANGYEVVMAAADGAYEMCYHDGATYGGAAAYDHPHDELAAW